MKYIYRTFLGAVWISLIAGWQWGWPVGAFTFMCAGYLYTLTTKDEEEKK